MVSAIRHILGISGRQYGFGMLVVGFAVREILLALLSSIFVLRILGSVKKFLEK